MIEDFSEGYYRMSMDAQVYGQGPAIEVGLYDHIVDNLNISSDVPVIMRLDLNTGPMFSVHAESAIPRNVLAVPGYITSDLGETDVYIMKGGIAEQFSGYYD